MEDGPGIRTTVFLKGCPLNCIWCHSPESQRHAPELIFIEKRCIGCGECAKVCSQKAHSLSTGRHLLDRKRCIVCGKCWEICSLEALEIKGRTVAASEVIKEIKKDIPFFRNTTGGVTFSGGEPTAQPKFLGNILKVCKEEGVHTALDTCGFVKWDILRSLLGFVDLFLYDIKHMDPGEHLKLTGKSNRLILDNLKKLVQEGKEVNIRVPLIPGMNDDEKNLTHLFSHIRTLGIKEAILLPFNEAAGSKYDWCGKRFPLANLKVQSDEQIKVMADLGSRLGVTVKVPNVIT